MVTVSEPQGLEATTWMAMGPTVSSLKLSPFPKPVLSLNWYLSLIWMSRTVEVSVNVKTMRPDYSTAMLGIPLYAIDVSAAVTYDI